MRRPDQAPAAPWFADLLERELRPWLTLSDMQVQQLWAHYSILLRWNQKMNLTSIPAGEEMVLRHYCESLFFGAYLPAETDFPSIADLGSGPGFPGVPLGILKPGWKITLLESNQRKAVFLRESTRGLSNISVSAQRAESVGETFDWVAARGVDSRAVLKNIPRLASRIGLLLGEDDFSAIKALGSIAWSKPIRLPWGDRRLCVYGMFHVEQLPWEKS